MNNRRNFAYFACICELLLAAGCDSGSSAGKDGGTNPRPDDRDPKPTVPSDLLKSASVSGIVVDVRGNRVAGAAVAVGALTAESNGDGEFDFEEIDVPDEAMMIVTRDGYSTGRVPLSVSEAAPNHVRVTLQAAEKLMLLDPSKGGDVESESGVVLKLKPGQIVDEDGQEVTVPVELLVSVINDRDEMAAAPGGMMALDPDADEDMPPTQLESFGMMEISMSADGKPVKLKGDTDTEVLLPMAPHHPFAQGEKVGLWHFDEEEEVWKNEGEGEVTAENKMKALVSHFSWWNADQIMTKTCVVGRVIDSRGRGIEAANVTGEGRSYLGSTHAMSDADGNFCLEARVSSVIELSTLVRIGNEQQALAVSVSTPRTKASCGMPSDCYVLPQDLVAVQAAALCDPAACPPDPAGEKEACCISDLGPCSYVVNGDCGGEEDGAWDDAPEEPGIAPIPGVPMPEPPSVRDAGMTMGTGGSGGEPGMDAGMMGTAGTSGGAGETGGTAGTSGSAGTGGNAGSGGSGPDPNPQPDGGTVTRDASTGGGADASLPASCGPALATACMQCVRTYCDQPASACLGNDWRDGSFTGACQNYMECMCDSPTSDARECETPENVTQQCQVCMAPVFSCSDEFCSNECGDGGGPEPTPVDRCGDVIPLGGIATVNGTTVGSQLLNDWYDDGRCGTFLQGYERSYSVNIGGNTKLRARVLGLGMQVLIAETCADIDGSCVADGANVEYHNYATDSRTVILTVDNFGYDVAAPFTLLLSDGEPSCGDGFVDYEEQCDDGNGATGDGCDDFCRVESGYVCPLDGACHEVVCGDGIVEGFLYGGSGGSGGEVPQGPGGAFEECDDGDTDPGDGCSEACQVESGYACNGSPSQCMVRPAGDMCSNALPLATGSYDLNGFSDDYPYTQGRDRMFQGTIPPGQLLEISGTAAFNGQIVVAAAEWCQEGPSRSFPIQMNQPFSITVDRASVNSETGNAVVIVASSTTGDSTFVFDMVGIVAPSCGDRVVSWDIGEECDDGNESSGDGCVNCRFEPGLLCDFEGYCENRPAGDLCNNAAALATGFTQGMYSMVGMSSDVLHCDEGCDVTRWFKITQQPGEVTAVLVNADFDGFFSLMTGSCPSYGIGGGPAYGAGFSPGYLGHAALVNESPAARPLWIRVTSVGGPTGNFELTTKTGPEGCGDGLRAGEGGPSGPMTFDEVPAGQGEECDDMNNASGDGCSATCHKEFGPFRCPYMGGPCEPIACGDGIIDRQMNAPYEECDDGDTSDGDGCSATCLMEDGMLCDGEPSDCHPAIPGDVCTNALPLPLGENTLVLDGFSSDLACTDLCAGNDAWFTRELQPRERLLMQLDSSEPGQVIALATGPAGCHDRFQVAQAAFGQERSGTLQVDNPTSSTITLRIVIGIYGDTGAVQMATTVGIPTEDCSSGECVPIACGDETRNGTEQCDDGGTADSDGCSSLCMVEAGFNCYGQGTSTCVPLVAGDTCEAAQWLSNGTFPMSGFTPDMQCIMGSCWDRSRWFRIDVPAGKVLDLNVTSANTDYADVAVVELPGGHCAAMNNVVLSGGFGSSYGPFHRVFVNQRYETAQLAIVVIDHDPENPSPTFDLDFSIDSIGCGDGYNDRSGYYGSPETCDDGGNASGDGCSPVCTQEPGWDCSSGVCEAVICGDERVTGDERCDDGGTASGDGCSPTCQPEPGYLCGGAPSTCAQYQPGDLCENALALVDGTYDMAGFLADLPCDNVCSSSPDRWFTLSVPQGQTLHVHATSTSPASGNIVAFDATDGCGPMHMISNWHPLGSGQDGHILYMNPSIGPRTIRIAVIQHPEEGEGSMPTFTLAHTLRPIGCGDAFVDTWGDQTASEECDDGNQQDGDGCSSSCTVEAGWDCFGAPSWCGLP